MEEKRNYTNPDKVVDVSVHDLGFENVYRVALFGELTEQWLAEWREYFYKIYDVVGHLSYIAEIHHDNQITRFFEGYGPVKAVEHNWRLLDIWDANGNSVAFCLIKLVDKSKRTTMKNTVEVNEDVDTWEWHEHV